jgi:hypothetical protein
MIVNDHLSATSSPEVPSGPKLFDEFANDWSKTLPAREQDILYLHLWAKLVKFGSFSLSHTFKFNGMCHLQFTKFNRISTAAASLFSWKYAQETLC